MTTIKVNGKIITIANKSTESFDTLDKESKALESLAINIEKSIEALNIVSNIKAMESFGYKSTEGVGEKIKASVKVVWEKIKEFFKKIGQFIVDFFKNGALKTRASMLLKKVEVTDEKDFNFNVNIDTSKYTASVLIKPIPISQIHSMIVSFFQMVKSEKIHNKIKEYDIDRVEDTTYIDDIEDSIENMEEAFDEIFNNTFLIDAEKVQPLSGDLNSKSKIIEYLKSIISGTDKLTEDALEVRKLITQELHYIESLKMNPDQKQLESLYQKYAMAYGKHLNNLAKMTVMMHNLNLAGIQAAIKPLK